MAHKSKKKHLKHARQHRLEREHEVAAARVKSSTTAPAKTAAQAKVAPQRKPDDVADDQPGIVRQIAKAATEKLTAKPRRLISRAKARVKSALGVG